MVCSAEGGGQRVTSAVPVFVSMHLWMLGFVPAAVQ